MSGFNTNVGYRIQINETRHTTPYEKILVYRITYTEVGQQPNIDLLYDDNLGENYYIFTDTGQEPIVSDTSFAEFKSYTTVKIIPNYIESKNDYLFTSGKKKKLTYTYKKLLYILNNISSDPFFIYYTSWNLSIVPLIYSHTLTQTNKH